MSKLTKWQQIAIICLASFMTSWVNLAWAGTGCEASTANPYTVAKASAQALALKKTLDAQDPKVALIARVGSDVTKYGMHYTHIGFAVKDYPGHKGEWTVVHLLNQCGTDTSSIYAQGLLNFFMDDLFTMDYQVTLLKPKLQKKLYQSLTSPLKLTLHNNHYNMLAYPFATKYQNSNQWVLEMITATHADIDTRDEVQQTLRETGYTPATIEVNGLNKLGAQLFKNHIKFDDHPKNEQSKGLYSVIGVDSVIHYLDRLGLVVSSRSYQ